MSETLAQVKALVARREVRVSAHGLRELAADNILLEEIAEGIDGAMVIEDYPASFQRTQYFGLATRWPGSPDTRSMGLGKRSIVPGRP